MGARITGTGPVMTASGGSVYRPRDATIALYIIAGMSLMVTYVETMVLPAFETFYKFFNYPPDTTIAWILSAYLLVGTIVTPVFGKLGDIYGKKKMLLVAMSIYAVAVSIAGFTPNIGAAFGVSRYDQVYLLIAARAFQGIGMGMFPLGYALLPEMFPADRVGRAQGVISAMFALGACLGLVIGGFLAENVGWQFTYHTIIPIAVLLPLLAIWKVPESPSTSRSRLDVVGASTLGLGLLFLLLAITEGPTWGWTTLRALPNSPIPWGVPELLILTALLLGFFVYWERRVLDPIIRPAALKVRNILVSNIDGLLVGITLFLAFTTNTYLIELPYPPGFAQPEFLMGVILVPSAISILAVAPIFGRMVGRYGPKPVMLIGFALMGVGAFLLTQVTNPAFQLGLIHTGAGFAVPVMMCVAPIFVLSGNIAGIIAMSNVIVLGVKSDELGVQTAMNQTFRNLGSALAPVLVTAILTSLAVGLYGSNPMFTLPGFQACYALLGICAVAGFLISLPLRNFRFVPGATKAAVVG